MILEDKNLHDRVVGEMIQAIDAKIQEREYIKQKFNENARMVDDKAQAIFGARVSIRMIKCIGGYNHYGIRNKMINGNGLTN